jgi:hypothetical protein
MRQLTQEMEGTMRDKLKAILDDILWIVAIVLGPI